MITTEYLEASGQVKFEFVTLYEKHRQYLGAIQESQMQAIQGQMMQGVMAQVSQQTAAKVASETIEQTLGQIRASVDEQRRNPMSRQLAESEQQGNAQPRRQIAGPPERRALPPSREARS
jgi:hypothetical protein